MGAVGRECDVVGHSDRCGNRDLGRAAGDVDLIEGRARDAAGKQMAGLVDSEPVHAMERRARDELRDLQVSANVLVLEKTAATKAAQANPCFMARPPLFWKVFARYTALANET
jgi:hypothetical protein